MTKNLIDLPDGWVFQEGSCSFSWDCLGFGEELGGDQELQLELGTNSSLYLSLLASGRALPHPAQAKAGAT